MFDAREFATSSGLELLENSELGQGEALVNCPPERLEETLVYLKNHLDFVFLSAITIEEKPDDKRVYYWLESIETGYTLGITLELSEPLFSIASIYQNAQGLEEELAQRHGIKLRSRPSQDKEAQLWKQKTSVEAAFVDENVRELLWLSGALNPFGETQVKVVSKNDTVAGCEVVKGNYHSGIEDAFTGKTVKECVSHLRKFDGYEGFAWSVFFYHALEKGNGIKVPDKGQAIRMIFMEFSRILSHLEFCAGVAGQLKAGSFHLKLLEWSALLENLQKLYSGNAYNLGVLAYGGAHREPPVNWISTCLKSLALFQADLDAYTTNISGSVFWRQCADIGRLKSADLLSWGIAGCALRASGVNFDLRKRRPFYLYDEVDFEVPIGIDGSLYDRILVRLREAFQSVGIIMQIMDNLPTGEVVAPEAQHFSHFDLEASEKEEDAYRDSIERDFKTADKMYQSTFETSCGLANICFSTQESKVSRLYLGSNRLSRLLCLETAAKGASFEDLPILLKSLQVDMRALEK